MNYCMKSTSAARLSTLPIRYSSTYYIPIHSLSIFILFMISTYFFFWYLMTNSLVNPLSLPSIFFLFLFFFLPSSFLPFFHTKGLAIANRQSPIANRSLHPTYSFHLTLSHRTVSFVFSSFLVIFSRRAFGGNYHHVRKYIHIYVLYSCKKQQQQQQQLVVLE